MWQLGRIAPVNSVYINEIKCLQVFECSVYYDVCEKGIRHAINAFSRVRREKLAREIQERLEERRREQMLRMRKTLIGRKPAWRALRSAARYVSHISCVLCRDIIM